jgi:acetyl esterase/lipase
MSGAKPVLSPQARELLDWAPVKEREWERDVEQARRDNRAWAQAFQGRREPVAAVEDLEAGGVTARLYRPEGDPSSAFVWLHGGGWLQGDPDCYDALARGLVNRVGCAVLSVDYRLIPEHRYPVPVDDAWAATRWAAERFASVAVGGDSSGGNLAAVVALRARDAGLALALQLLVYPMLDPRLDSPYVEAFVTRYTQLGDWQDFGANLREGLRHAWALYAPDPSQREQPDVGPARAASLDGLPPAYIVLVEHDILRGEGEAYARRLEEAGVPVEVRCYARQVHGFYGLLAIEDARHELERSADVLRRAFAAADRTGAAA